MRNTHTNGSNNILVIVIILFIGIAGFFLYRNSSFKLRATIPPLMQEAKRIAEKCASVSTNQTTHEKCTAQEFAAEGQRWGIAFMGEVLTVYQSIKKGYQAYQNCHVLAHEISNILASQEPDKWQELLRQMSGEYLDPNLCGGGFVHGILEVRAGADPNFKINADLFQELCAETLMQVSSSCAHILGHLALVEEFGKIDEAFKACQGLLGDFLFQCYGGIFMEDSMRTNLNDHGLADLPERNTDWLKTQIARCNRYAHIQVTAEGCWYDLPEVFLQTHYYDLEKTYQFCDNAPNKEARDHCYIRASYLVAIAPDSLFTIFPAQQLCASYKSGDGKLTRCMQEVIGAALTGSISFLDRVISFCIAREDNSKNQCFAFIAGHLTRLHNPQEKKMLCKKLPEHSRAPCLSDK